MPEEFYTKCYLLNGVDLDEDYEYTIDFDDETSQYNFFYAKKQLPITDLDFSYIRAEQPFKVGYKLSELEDIDYLMYQNEENEKWYYAFITKKEYANPETTRLYVKLDVMQTYMFDYELKESFVDREHQDRYDGDGKPIYNLQEENLNIGTEYNNVNTKVFEKDDGSDSSDNARKWLIIKAKEPLGKFGRGWSYRAVDSWADDTYTNGNFTTKQNGVDTGIYVYIAPSESIFEVHCEKIGGTTPRMVHFRTSADIYKNPNVISITPVRYIPYIQWIIHPGNPDQRTDVKFIETGTVSKPIATFNIATDGDPVNENYILFVENYGNEDFEIEYPETDTHSISIDNIKSINNEPKLKTYPYNYLRMNVGNEYKDYRRENFSNGIKFGIKQSIGFNGGMNIIPKNYNNDDDKFSLLQQKNIPNITLRTSAWQTYMLENKASMNGGLVVGGLQTLSSIGIGLATGGIGLAVAGSQALGFGGQIANEMLKREDIKNKPDDIRPNIDDTEMINMLTNLAIKIDEVEIKDMFKIAIFNYLYHYGYKCNDFKIPNIRSRYYFNYIKTIGVNLTSDISGEYKQALKDIFNRGITIWHYRDANTFKGVNNFDYENAEMALI